MQFSHSRFVTVTVVIYILYALALVVYAASRGFTDSSVTFPCLVLVYALYRMIKPSPDTVQINDQDFPKMEIPFLKMLWKGTDGVMVDITARHLKGKSMDGLVKNWNPEWIAEQAKSKAAVVPGDQGAGNPIRQQEPVVPNQSQHDEV